MTQNNTVAENESAPCKAPRRLEQFTVKRASEGEV